MGGMIMTVRAHDARSAMYRMIRRLMVAAEPRILARRRATRKTASARPQTRPSPGRSSPQAGTSIRAEDPAARCGAGRTRPRRETCQSFVSLANGDKIRTLRKPNSTITASSSSTRTTQPRPYLSWVT